MNRGSGQGISTICFLPEGGSTSCINCQPGRKLNWISPLVPLIRTPGAPCLKWTTCPFSATSMPWPPNSVLPPGRRGVSPVALTQAGGLSRK